MNDFLLVSRGKSIKTVWSKTTHYNIQITWSHNIQLAAGTVADILPLSALSSVAMFSIKSSKCRLDYPKFLFCLMDNFVNTCLFNISLR